MVDETDQRRAARYLKMATDTAAQAPRCGDAAIAEAYLHLASIWLRMAEELTQGACADGDVQPSHTARS
ncbi:MAG TPA: hypothetical protein VLI41_11960 [Phenylobacterium sp.]|uniref:hypothetical protein n=1 Tax=Phenylobacterium sp. TaxID=1871053 RepID=UPI002CC6CB88|nr:hypothetical protein [Phenylobacterium sp.]HSV03907.1 hypothetical protein [Phenylobacterium sp.]